MQSNINTLLAILRKPLYSVIALTGAVAFWIFILMLTDFEAMAGNLGRVHTTIYAAISILLAVLVGVYFALFISRIRTLRPSSATGIVGTGAGMLVTGCTSCSVTLASFVGLGGAIALLPFGGLEINVLAIILLAFSIKKLTDPATCRRT